MNEHDVRIVNLESMHIAAAIGFGHEPEGIAWDKILAFVSANNLTDKKNTRYFGFNNPNPSAGSPNYGYEQWVTVPQGTVGTDDVEIKDFSGGLYAVLRCQGIDNIGHSWQQLVSWAENSQYHQGHHQWLEEVLTPPPTPEADFVLDLYMPITE